MQKIRMRRLNGEFSKMKKYLSRLSRISFFLTAVSVLVYAIAIRSVDFADYINGTVSAFVRAALSFLTYGLPFSLFESLVIFSPVILVCAVVIFIKRAENKKVMIRSVFSLITLISLIFTSYIFTLGVGYRTTPLSKKIGIEEDKDVTAEELYFTLTEVIDGLNTYASLVTLDNGETVMQYSVDDMSEKLIEAYDKMNEEYSLVTNFTSRVKPVYFSTVMSDLGISGIYSFFTGEANVNVEYPDYCLPFTAAHELAHQRGICRENEANFVAFLVCIASDDDYVRYSGYLNMYEYLASALYRTDRELYREALKNVPDVALYDMIASNEVYKKHKDSPLGRINDRLNDAYLKANGTEGVVSYGYVVRLAVGYYKEQK